MLDEGARRARRGTRVVLAALDAGRPGLPAVDGLAGSVATDATGRIDVPAVLSLDPHVALVDRLAFQPAGGGEPHWQSVERLLAAGVDVVSTLDLGEIESLAAVVAGVAGVGADATVPDDFLRSAGQVQLVDITPDALRRRLAHGRIVPPERLDATMAHRYRADVLAALRQLSLTWMTERATAELEATRSRLSAPAGEARERVVVAISGRGSDASVRRAARLAAAPGASLVGVHVVAGDAEPGPSLERHRTLLTDLGGTYRELVADDVALALAEFAEAERATQVVVGRRDRSMDARSVTSRLIRRLHATDVHVVHDPVTRRPVRLATPARQPRPRRAVLAGWVLAVVAPVVLTALLTLARRHVAVGTALLADLCVVMVVAALGGLAPGLIASALGFVLTNWYLTPPLHTLNIRASQNVVALGVFVLITVVISVLVDRTMHRTREATLASAQAGALARSAATLVGSADPLPELLDQLRAAFALDAASVLQRDDANPAGWWPAHVSGEPALLSPDEGWSVDLAADGSLRLVISDNVLRPDQIDVLRGFADQLAVAMESRRLREDAAQADLLVEANALRAAMLQAVSHDFRTPLATIRAAATGLMQQGVDFDQADRLQLLGEIDASAERLDRMVGNLLDMTRLQAGAVELRLEAVALEEVVAAALAATPAGARRAQVDVPESLPLVRADAGLLERALANVISNAQAWSPADQPIRIEASRVGDGVSLVVVDQGPGIPVAQRQRIFEPFHRVGDRSHDAGAGLGLAIARGFLEAMGGSIHVEDTPGGGTTMVLSLLVDHRGEPGAGG